MRNSRMFIKRDFKKISLDYKVASQSFSWWLFAFLPRWLICPSLLQFIIYAKFSTYTNINVKMSFLRSMISFPPKVIRYMVSLFHFESYHKRKKVSIQNQITWGRILLSVLLEVAVGESGKSPHMMDSAVLLYIWRPRFSVSETSSEPNIFILDNKTCSNIGN